MKWGAESTKLKFFRIIQKKREKKNFGTFKY